uniref:Uncharacterized protein n=1 Tax=Oryza rufipogon TaxID=4529 RepID=A0A0E0NWV0_ORYRU
MAVLKAWERAAFDLYYTKSWLWVEKPNQTHPSHRGLKSPTKKTAFVLLLSLLFLVHIAISHALFSPIDSDDSDDSGTLA